MSDTEKLSRRQLYDLVWRKPVEDVAAEYGLSGRGLGKLCERNSIPVPPRGYWARKAAGQKVARPPLIDFGTGEKNGPFVLMMVPSKVTPLDGSAEAITTVDPFAVLWAEQTSAISLRVGKALSSQPHMIVAKWLAEDQRRRDLAKSSFGYGLSPEFSGTLDRRRLRIFDALFKLFNDMGLKVEHDSRNGAQLTVRMNRDCAQFTLSEYIRRYRRPVPAVEHADGRKSRQSWTQEQEATGQLIFKITTGLPESVRANFRDQEGDSLEDQLHKAVAALVVSIAYAKSIRVQQEAEEHRRWEEYRRVRKLEEERKAEEARKAALRAEAANWREAALLREYVAAVRSDTKRWQSDLAKGALEVWSACALRHADEIDPLIDKGAEGVDASKSFNAALGEAAKGSRY